MNQWTFLKPELTLRGQCVQKRAYDPAWTPGLLGTLPCVVALISSFYDLSNIFGSYLVNSSGSFLASPSDMEPPQEWSFLTICPKIGIFQPQLPWRSNGCCQGSLSSAFFGGEWIPPKLSSSIIGQTVYSLEGKSHCFWLNPTGNQIWQWNISTIYTWSSH